MDSSIFSFVKHIFTEWKDGYYKEKKLILYIIDSHINSLRLKKCPNINAVHDPTLTTLPFSRNSEEKTSELLENMKCFHGITYIVLSTSALCVWTF